MSNYEKCPFCDPDKPWQEPYKFEDCVLNKPLMMVIPPGGIHLSCPVHPAGHHIHGTNVRM